MRPPFKSVQHATDLHGADRICQVVEDLAAWGLAAVTISDEIPEVLDHCDRILAMREPDTMGLP